MQSPPESSPCPWSWTTAPPTSPERPGRGWPTTRTASSSTTPRPTPSWLNQIELFFSILGRRLLHRGEFASIDELTAKVLAFIDDYNRQAKPFRWTYEGKPLKAL